MTDKEIATWLYRSRWHAAKAWGGWSPRAHASTSVKIIHHIINSINWED